MSKFIDRLKQVSQPPTLSIGFRPKKAESTRPKIQLIAYACNSTINTEEKAFSAADAIVVQSTYPGHKKVLWGAWLTWGSEEEMAQVEKAGADFVICPTTTTAFPTIKKIGRVLRIDISTSDGLLRAVNGLPVDAIILAEEPGSITTLTWNRLLLIRRFADFVAKPLLVFISPTITEDSLQLLWEMGVSGVVVDLKEDTDIAVLDNLRNLINGLRYPVPKKREGIMPVLPQTVAKTEKPEEPDEDDDDDD